MKNRIVKYLFYSLAWALFMGYVILSIKESVRHTKEQKINNIEIHIEDSKTSGNLVTEAMVEGWITHSGVKLMGETLRSANISKVERQILNNGFIEEVKIYPSYHGKLTVEVKGRQPRLRLLVDGYNHYITDEGYVFKAPLTTSIYTSVVTGGYTPPFPASYTGSIDEFMKLELDKINKEIEDIEREKYPYFKKQQQNQQDKREVNKMFIKKGWIESHKAFDKRVDSLRKKKADLRRLYRYNDITYAARISEISAKQQRLEARKKKLVKSCEDCQNLINFVKIIDKDDFWSSEIVQIVASHAQSGEIKISFSVRSGNFLVTLGDLTQTKERLDKLMTFYEKGLNKVGWDRYKSINIEYRDQVVCK
ncbi:MAG: hypothetical protein SNH28_08325 [Rikenellaceae bacterium]